MVCFRLIVHRIEPATLAHIHIGSPTVAGPVVVDFVAPTDGSSSGCVMDADADAIAANPSNYYVNVHNTSFMAGAVRGQLDSGARYSVEAGDPRLPCRPSAR